MSVVVVGAGPVGLAMASELTRHGVRCRIIDQSPAPATGTRASALQARTLEILDDMGVIQPILEAGHRIHGAGIFAEGRRILHFSFDELASPYPFALDIPQQETERILTAHLRTLGVEVERSATLTRIEQTADGISLEIEDHGNSSIKAAHVIGCDGARSAVRRLSAIPSESIGPEETFLVADVHADWGAPDDEWYFWFHEDGLFSLFPLGAGRYRAVVDVAGGTEGTEDEFRAAFADRGPKDARILEASRIFVYPVARGRASTYRHGRVFIAGDAAHVQNPAGGQGMNTGIQDSYNLAWKLAMVLRGNAPDTLLDSYTAERRPVARSVSALTENFASIASLRSPIPQGIRNRLIPVLAGFEVFEHRLVDRLAEISVNYRNSPAVGQFGRWYAAGPAAGDRAPRVFDLLRGTRHVVLLFAAEHTEKEDVRGFQNIERYMRDGYGSEISTHLIARTEMSWSGPMILDHDGAAHHAYGAGVPCVYLIRPDGYVGFRSLSADPLPLLEYLNRVYEPPMQEIALA